ncbi:G-type lectin S-receptor-like serine/threonine-protein kinase [Dorcoceras hygrometricum]|uniref:G-type lectin S-receptor-like serine/threonine-protein kinase n=1 Tax=Dorcoceras hygrometricum TaxID=472368 RepID=A0A2Z7CWM6_9LAMI|nr:G-type lectin S-receptor-like serine/threonine-protein kinase [Dorcoceras hygrometricum]
MRIRPPELETSICDAKYHVSLVLSVTPRGSWRDAARRFTMIRWASPKLLFRSRNGCGPTASCIPEPLRVTQLNQLLQLLLSSHLINISSQLNQIPLLFFGVPADQQPLTSSVSAI